MADETKACPYCGEEILIIAKKCKHCGEFLNNDVLQEKSWNNCIAKANVNDKWKERFRAVDFFVINGKWWRYNSNFWKSSFDKKWEMTLKLYSDFGSFVATCLFTGLYYCFKGMWLKCLIYTSVCLLIKHVIPEFADKIYILYGAICASFAPYDYYRLKVLGKQW